MARKLLKRVAKAAAPKANVYKQSKGLAKKYGPAKKRK